MRERYYLAMVAQQPNMVHGPLLVIQREKTNMQYLEMTRDIIATPTKTYLLRTI